MARWCSSRVTPLIQMARLTPPLRTTAKRMSWRPKSFVIHAPHQAEHASSPDYGPAAEGVKGPNHSWSRIANTLPRSHAVEGPRSHLLRVRPRGAPVGRGAGAVA